MSQLISYKQPTFVITIIFACLAIIADIVAIFIGVAYEDNGYLAKLNWSLFPIFFIIVGFLIHSSWHLFISAWKSIHDHSVIYSNDGAEATASMLAPLIHKIESKRKYILIISVILGLLITSIDAGCIWGEYGLIEGMQQCHERDFSVAFAMKDTFPDADITSNGLFNIYVYFLQGALIAAGWIALLQLTIHTYYIFRFEETKEAKNASLTLQLNINDPLQEFGFTEVNRALNIAYINIALVMVIPVLSTANQQLDYADLGQWLLRILLPLLILLPILITYIDRIGRIKEASNRALKSNNKEDHEDFLKQRLWPFDKTQLAYVGKIAVGVAVVEYIYLINGNVISLINAIKKIV